MKNTETIKKNYEFKNVLNKGKKINGKYINIFFLKNNKNFNFLGIAINSKSFNAVKRNRGKRLIREAYTSIEDKIYVGYSFVITIKKDIIINEINSNIIKEELSDIMTRVGIYNENNINKNN